MLAMGFSSPVFAAEKEQAKKIAKKEKPKIEVCFVLDTTGSMGSLANAMAGEFGRIAADVSGRLPDVTFGAATYEDFRYGSMGDPGDKPFVRSRAAAASSSLALRWQSVAQHLNCLQYLMQQPLPQLDVMT